MSTPTSPAVPTYAVGYAYPTSPSAVRFGFSKTGCHIVQRTSYRKDGCHKPPVALSGHATKEQAQEQLKACTKCH